MNFRSISTTSLAGLCVAAGLSFVAPMALADLPDVLSAAPKDTKIFLGTTSLGEMDKQWKQLMTAIEMEEAAVFAPTDMFGQLGVSVSTLDLTRSIGVAMMNFDSEADQPPIVMLLPVVDYAKWAANFGPAVSTDGVAEVIIDNGETAYIRSAGRYAVLSPSKELAEAYVAQDNAAAFKKRIGAVGEGVIERSQVFAIVDFEGIAQDKQQIVATFSEILSQQVAQMGAMGMGMPMGEDVAKMNEAVIGMIIDECSGIVAGLRYGERGIAIDFAVQTREGGKISSMMPGTDKPRNLLTSFEDTPFMFAMSMDYRGIKIGPLLDEIKTRLGIEDAVAGQPNMMANADIWRNSDGMASAVYPSPGGMFAGLLSRSITMLSGDSEKIIGTLREAMTNMNETDAPGGMHITTQYSEDAMEIGGIKADTYAVKMIPPPEMMQMQQAMAMIYGPGGMQGYILPVKGGVLQTTSRNAEVVQKTLAVINGEAPGLGNNKAIAAVDTMLPPNPSMRFYIGLGAISQMAAPMAAMAAPGLDLQEFAALPPLGIGASILNGGLVGSFAVPVPVIKSVVEMAQQFGGMGGGGEMSEEEPPLF